MAVQPSFQSSCSGHETRQEITAEIQRLKEAKQRAVEEEAPSDCSPWALP